MLEGIFETEYMIETNKLAVASYGEALWDCIPDGLFLGGAPFNAAYHLASLGVQSYPITCVGDDLLGDQVFERAKSAGLNTDFIKRHEILETGVALAKLDDQGNAEYDIRLPSAWDEIELSAEEMALLNELDAIIYGSLVTRSELSRDTLETLLENFSGLKVCDINLRSPYDDLKRAIHFARLADIVKLNHDDLYRVIAANPMDFAVGGNEGVSFATWGGSACRHAGWRWGCLLPGWRIRFGGVSIHRSIGYHRSRRRLDLGVGGRSRQRAWRG